MNRSVRPAVGQSLADNVIPRIGNAFLYRKHGPIMTLPGLQTYRLGGFTDDSIISLKPLPQSIYRH